MTLEELWCIRTGSCQFSRDTKPVESMERGVGPGPRGHTTVWPSVPVVKIISGERKTHCVRQDVK
jgi:hypothetical protein